MLPLFRIVLSSVLVFSLASCVTTEEPLFKKTSTKKEEVEARVKIAISYLQDGQADLALVHLKDALAVDPDSARVNEITALSLEKTGEYDLAAEHFEVMLDEEPEYTRGRSNYASFLMRQKSYEAAYKQFKIVVDFNIVQSNPN